MRAGLLGSGVLLPLALAAWSSAALAAEQVTVKAEMVGTGADSRVFIATQALLQITVTSPVGAEIFVPQNPEMGPFRRTDAAPVIENSPAVDGRATQVHRLAVMPLRFGVEKVPAIEVPYRLAGGVDGVATTERLRVMVHRYLENEDPPRLGSAPPPAEVISTNWALVWLLALAGTGLVAGLLTLVGLRLFAKQLQASIPAPPPPPANELALGKLVELESLEVSGSERYASAIDILREYLGGRYGFDGLETTTVELFGALAEQDLKTVTLPEIEVLIDEADLIKFARLTVSDEDGLAKVSEVRRMVLETWEEPEVEEEVVLRLERASVSERARAGLVDVGIGLGVSGALFGLLWGLGYPDWGWVAALVLGLMLLCRDLSFEVGSPGKLLLGLQVVTTGESQMSAPVAARLSRNMLLLLPPIGLPVAALVLAYHPMARRLGDGLSGTEVVRGGASK